MMSQVWELPVPIAKSRVPKVGVDEDQVSGQCDQQKEENKRDEEKEKQDIVGSDAQKPQSLLVEQEDKKVAVGEKGSEEKKDG